MQGLWRAIKAFLRENILFYRNVSGNLSDQSVTYVAPIFVGRNLHALLISVACCRQSNRLYCPGPEIGKWIRAEQIADIDAQPSSRNIALVC